MKNLPLLNKAASGLFAFNILLGAMVSHASAVESAGQQEPTVLVDYEKGDACMLVFGKVGEAFECRIEKEEKFVKSEFTVGFGASGERCSLPKGIKIDKRRGVLFGVPQEPGFHEFVALVTEKGVTRERVFLIDIEKSGLNPARSAFASSYFSAAR